MRFLAVSKARSDLPALVDSVERVVLTKNGEPVAVLLHLDDYRALRAMQRMAGQPERWATALAAHERVQRGDLSGFPELHGGVAEEVAEPEPRWAEEITQDALQSRMEQMSADFQDLARAAGEFAERFPDLDDGIADQLNHEAVNFQERFLRRRRRRGRKTAKG